MFGYCLCFVRLDLCTCDFVWFLFDLVVMLCGFVGFRTCDFGC